MFQQYTTGTQNKRDLLPYLKKEVLTKRELKYGKDILEVSKKTP
jgi:hypothetical protein